MKDLEPYWDGSYLVLPYTKPVYRIGGWPKALKVEYLANSTEHCLEQWQEIDLYDKFGMSLAITNKNHEALNEWIKTIPVEVRKTCKLYPANQFYLARVLTRHSSYLGFAERYLMPFIWWAEHCRNNAISEEELYKQLDKGIHPILAKLEITKDSAEQVLRATNKISDFAISSVPSDFILRCFKRENYAHLLYNVDKIYRWHFEFLSIHPSIIESSCIHLMMNAPSEEVPFDKVIGIRYISRDIRWTAKAILQKPSTQELKLLTNTASLKAFSLTLIKASKARIKKAADDMKSR